MSGACVDWMALFSAEGVAGRAGREFGRWQIFFQHAVSLPVTELSLPFQVERDFEREYGKLQQ